MYIKKLTWRVRNDFGFICACQHCDFEFKRSDGYADARFQQEVLPNQRCPECNKNHWGELPPTEEDGHETRHETADSGSSEKRPDT